MAFEACSKWLASESKEIGFELLGFDFMVDSDLRSYLIEVNTNPCLSTIGERQGRLIHRVVGDSLWLALGGVCLSDKEEGPGQNNPDEYQTDYELIHMHFL